MQHEVVGSTMPVLEIHLDPSESVIAVAGELSWMTSSIDLHTTTQHGGGGGLFGALKRAVSGGSLFMTEYTARNTAGTVAFAAKLPGHIIPVTVGPGQEYMIHRHGFLCATPQAQLTVGFQQSLGAGVFGGDGFILQRLSGEAQAWVELGGETVIYDLRPGETLRVHPGHVGMFEAGVNFDITRIKGIRNMLFGGDGIFLAELTGPGKVWLQTLTVSNLAHALIPYLPSGGGERTATNVGAGAVVGGVLGSILGGNNS
ncbi:MAG TPA: TIGR00266 family protein [Chthoniobacteraceae bacterium]|jgi:uncharacterized protein (TIGR00266 family)|nr:TIGR00266 family protein [Chthoniobacteraceae bacterium]